MKQIESIELSRQLGRKMAQDVEKKVGKKRKKVTIPIDVFYLVSICKLGMKQVRKPTATKKQPEKSEQKRAVGRPRKPVPSGKKKTTPQDTVVVS
ncbi:MAG: hypothetical protein GY820_01435 [Gammaproteobacteria bacterium]|nr:hypothetical protein [Gammaproteobacteria bacterium]